MVGVLPRVGKDTREVSLSIWRRFAVACIECSGHALPAKLRGKKETSKRCRKSRQAGWIRNTETEEILLERVREFLSF